MADVLANVTQVINQSPQVSSLVGGHMAALEDAKRQAQVEESARQRDALAKMVQGMENSAKVDSSDPEERRRESRRRDRNRRSHAARAARRAAQARESEENGACSTSETSSDSRLVIDICV